MIGKFLRRNFAYHAQAARLVGSAFHWNRVAGDEAMHVVAIQDAIVFYEQARQLMVEQSPGTIVPVLEIGQFYMRLGQAYELNAEWEKAQVAYQSMLTYAQDASLPEMERTAHTCLATLAAQQSLL